jgi:hypothetical protein
MSFAKFELQVWRGGHWVGVLSSRAPGWLSPSPGVVVGEELEPGLHNIKCTTCGAGERWGSRCPTCPMDEARIRQDLDMYKQ